MANTAWARLELCRDILVIRAAKAKVPADKERNARLLAANRIKAIRRVLLGRPGRSLADDLLSPSIAKTRLMAILEESKGQSKARQIEVAAYANELASLIYTIEKGEDQSGLSIRTQGSSFDIQDAISDVLGAVPHEVFDPLVDESIERGKFSDDFREEIAKASAAADKKSSMAGQSVSFIQEANPELAAKQKEASQKTNDLVERVRELKALAEEAYKNAVKNNGDASLEAKFADLQAQYKAAFAEYDRFYEKDYKGIAAQVADAIRAAREKLSEPFAEVGQRVIDDIAAASSITPSAAIDWASRQEISSSAKLRLKKVGYPVDRVVADMAEFYRLTNGRVQSVKIKTSGGKRANADNINSALDVGVINLGSGFDKRVLWHELAHHIEADPVARLAASRFIRRRAESPLPYSLRSLTGNKGYRKDEIAFKDGFFSEYIGKVYKDGMTEVFSMGVESLSNPQILGQRMAQDPQTLEFVTGFLKAPIDPLATALFSLRESVRGLNGEARDEAKDSVSELIAKLAANGDTLVELTGKDREFIESRPVAWVVQQNKWTAVARFSESDVTFLFAGKVKRRDTGRKCSGLIIVGFKGYYIDDFSFDTTDRNVIRAASAAWRKNGVWPSAAQLENEGYLKKALE